MSKGLWGTASAGSAPVRPSAGGGSETGSAAPVSPLRKKADSRLHSKAPRERAEGFRQGCDNSFALYSLQRDFNYFSLDLHNNSGRREGRLIISILKIHLYDWTLHHGGPQAALLSLTGGNKGAGKEEGRALTMQQLLRITHLNPVLLPQLSAHEFLCY